MVRETTFSGLLLYLILLPRAFNRKYGPGCRAVGCKDRYCDATESICTSGFLYLPCSL
jgi:hypothetical protein